MYAGVPIDVPICVSVAPPAVGARGADRFRDPEVRHHRRAAGEQHVVGLDVAMHDAALMRVRERLRRRRCMTLTTSVIASGPRARSRAQRFALDERHRVEAAGRPCRPP